MNDFKTLLDNFVDEKIINTSLEDVMAEGFSRYSKYIIQERALPDVRDGLKPVQRRILYGMNQMGVASNKPYKKCARITGEVMGKYHPHGDSSIYESLVRMSQDFKMLVPLVDMHGNNGSIDGDSPAAMRYTEARMSKAAEIMLEDLEKRTVPFVPNFDDQELEPTVLPAKFPNLLVNGTTGIAAGYATKIPPHNLSEVINATIHLLKNPNATVVKLMQFIKGPDFPTGGIIQGKDEIVSAFTTGAGKVVVRGKATIKENIDNTQIIITEIPYEVNKSILVHSIDQLRVNKILEDIIEVRDETDQTGLQIAIDLKKGCDPNIVMAYLFKNTDLQVYYNYNMISIIDHKPQQTGILPILSAYISHYKQVITNRSNYLLEKAEKRKHIVMGLIKMVSILDEVIKIIRGSLNKANAKENLISMFDFTELQAEAIVTLQLYRLSSTDVEDLKDECIELDKTIKELHLILEDEETLKNVIEKELRLVQGLLGEKRKSLIEEKIETIKINEKELVSEEEVMIGITREGYVTRSSIRSFNQTKIPGLKQNDAFIFEDECNTLETLLIFTNQGNYIYLPIYKIEDQKWGDLGTFLGNIVPIKGNEKPIAVILVKDFETNQDILIATKKAFMKQVKLRDLKVSRYSKPIKAINLSRGDEVVAVDIDSKPNIICSTYKGYLLRYRTIELPQYGLQASGVRSINLGPDDHLSGACYIAESDSYAVLTTRGHIIREEARDIPLYNRNRKGYCILEQLKTNPHYLLSICSLSKMQDKKNTKVNIVTDRLNFYTHCKDLKYIGNKFGKKHLQAEDGIPVLLFIQKTNEEEVYTQSSYEYKPKPKKDKQIEEIIITPEINNDLDTFDLPEFDSFSEEDSDELIGFSKELEQQLDEDDDAYLSTKILTEEIMTKDKQKIKLTKLDFWDQDDE